MKKALVIFLLILFSSGCASYKFQRGREPYDKGYVVSRDGYAIVEYTLGEDNSVPDLELAQERFKKRKDIVEYYYKKMGYIENRFKMAFWDPAVIFVKMALGIFRLPFVAISDYKYEHNPEYRAEIRKLEDERDAKEEARTTKLKDKLNAYILEEFKKEGL